MRILVVDDSPAMRVFIRRVLQLTGMDTAECVEASNGKEALDLLMESDVDVILCDVNMPVMNGEQFVQQLRRQGMLDRMRVVVVSTDATSTRMQRMMDLGASGYLQKPFTPEDLQNELQRALDSGVLRR